MGNIKATLEAADLAFKAAGRLAAASVAMAAASAKTDPITYDEPVDLSVYDCAFKVVT